MQIHLIVALLMPLLLWPVAVAAVADEPGTGERLQLLKRHGVGAETDDLIAYLRGLQPDAAQQNQIAALIKQLSSSKFSERETAMAKLATFGSAARAKLLDAMRSLDTEVAWRTEKILKQLEADGEQQLRKSLTSAALQVLKTRGEAQALPVLLQTLHVVHNADLRDDACEAIWASTDVTHAALLQQALADENLDVRAAAIVAWEIAVGDRATATLTAHLQSKLAPLRLAAARAMADRQPRVSIAVLIELAGNENEDISRQADALLQMLAGKRLEPSSQQSLAEAWRTWSEQELPTAKLNTPLGKKRFDLRATRDWLEETFSRDAPSLTKGYGRFHYEADAAGGASVAGGRLLIDGESDEQDQRLFITSRRMIDRDQWPQHVEVRAKLGGQEGNNFGWHVGVSVGRAKVLFHPGLSGGAFRVETTDTHEYLLGNENMGFTPATSTFHEMIIKVTKLDEGALFDVTVRDANSDSVHGSKLKVSNAQLGEFNRIGLERSGRRGAAAMFDSVSIKLSR